MAKDIQALDELTEEAQAEIEAKYMERYGMPLPDLTLALPQEVLGFAIEQYLREVSLIEHNKYISSMVIPVTVSEDGTVPMAIYLSEIPEDALVGDPEDNRVLN